MLDNIMKKEFTITCGNYNEDMVAIYNENNISEDEVDRFIKFSSISGVKYHPAVICCYEDQWKHVFGEYSKEEV